MKLYVDIQIDGIIHRFGILNSSDFCKIYLPDYFVIYFYKEHNHCYFFKAFFYQTQYIYFSSYFRSKSLLFEFFISFLRSQSFNVFVP